MTFRAVALSHADGAGGESVGYALAKRLGFGYVDEEIVAQVAEGHGVQPEIVADAERRKTLLTRFVDDLGVLGAFTGMAPDPSALVLDRSDDFLALIRDAVREMADRGDAVIVAHAASFACADRSDVLRVFITAPADARARRYAKARGMSEKAATDAIRKSDAGRASYLKRVYKVDRESPTDYDVVVNTDHLDVDAAVDAVMAVVRPSEQR